MRAAHETGATGLVADWVARFVIAISIGVVLAVLANVIGLRRDLVGWDLALWGVVGFLAGALSPTVATAAAPPALMGLTIVATAALLDGVGAAPKDTALLRLASIAILAVLAMAAAGVTGHGARILIAQRGASRSITPRARPRS